MRGDCRPEIDPAGEHCLPGGQEGCALRVGGRSRVVVAEGQHLDGRVRCDEEHDSQTVPPSGGGQATKTMTWIGINTAEIRAATPAIR
jgi:hypothetical protein